MINQIVLNTAAAKMAEAAHILLDAQEGSPSLRVLRIATETSALACEVLASGLLEKGGE